MSLMPGEKYVIEPGSQRSDGSWRKPRRIRSGFGTYGGGPKRYVPPPRRHDIERNFDQEDLSALGETRSLDQVASLGRSGSGDGIRHAALFLLINYDSASPIYPKDAHGKRCASLENASKTSQHHVAILRDVTTIAKGELSCDTCRPLASAVRSTRHATADDSSLNENAERDRTWWSRFDLLSTQCQKTQSTLTEPDQSEWIGLELILRTTDVSSEGGHAALVSFMKNIARLRNTEGTVATAGSTTAIASNDARSLAEVNLLSSDGIAKEHREETPSPLTIDQNKAVNTHGHASRNSDDVLAAEYDEDQSESSSCPETNVESPSEEAHEDSNIVQGLAGPYVAEAAVLIFGGYLSKGDRAALHTLVQEARDVKSASYGIGADRCLALSVDLEDIDNAQGPKLSASQADTAQRLFKLAQEQYHSRYESFSHGEIREICAAGGPTKEAHADLYRLLETREC